MRHPWNPPITAPGKAERVLHHLELLAFLGCVWVAFWAWAGLHWQDMLVPVAVVAVVIAVVWGTNTRCRQEEALGYFGALLILSTAWCYGVGKVGTQLGTAITLACGVTLLLSRAARHLPRSACVEEVPDGDDPHAGLEDWGMDWVGEKLLGDCKGPYRGGTDREGTDHEPDHPDAERCCVEEWKTVIETQMHFNDMLQRIRLTGLSVALTVSAAAATTLGFERASEPFRICGQDVHLAAAVQLCSVVLIIGLMFSESYFYALLIGAVSRGAQIENGRGFGLTSCISRVVPRRWADRRLSFFWYTALIPAIAFLYILVVCPPKKAEPPVASAGPHLANGADTVRGTLLAVDSRATETDRRNRVERTGRLR